MTVDGLVLQTLKERNLRIPQDVAVASTSVADIPVSAGLNQNSEEIGRVAILLLLSQINDNARGLPPICRQSLVQGRWIDGASLPDRNPAVATA